MFSAHASTKRSRIDPPPRSPVFRVHGQNHSNSNIYQPSTNMSFRGGRGGNRGGRGGHFGGRRDIEEGPPERVVGRGVSVFVMGRARICHARGGG